MSDMQPIIVVGGGNAGLVAAITARELGRQVLLIEASEKDERGGNSRYASGILRMAHGGAEDLRTLVDGDHDWTAIDAPPYTAREYIDDIVADAPPTTVDPELVETFVVPSLETVRWLRDHGVHFRLLVSPAPGGEGLRLPRGGEIMVEGNGRELVETLYRAAEQAGVEFSYGHRVDDLVVEEGTVTGVRLDDGRMIAATSVVLASASFEASAERRAEHLGPQWAAAKVRGTRQNDGGLLDRALAFGAVRKGDWSLAHAVPVDIDAPALGDIEVGDSTARYSFPWGITVNRDGERFVNEGADEAPFVYSEFGRRILAEPGSVAYQIFDSSALGLLEPRYATTEPFRADSIEQLEAAIGLPSGSLQRTVAAFNAACPAGGTDPKRLDGVAARPAGQPPKSNWARAIAEAPFVAYPVTCGITFSNGGLAVDSDARVLDGDGRPIPGLLAAGEITGGFFRTQVPSGAGLVRGAVFGRLAGRSAALRTAALS